MNADCQLPSIKFDQIDVQFFHPLPPLTWSDTAPYSVDLNHDTVPSSNTPGDGVRPGME